MSRAKYLLENFPALWAQARGEAEDALEGNRGHGFIEGGRDQGGHSDPTARRAGSLFEANTFAGELDQVRRWIDTQLNPAERSLLITRWRLRQCGWWWVARELRMGVAECIARWELICRALDKYLMT